ncbi:hypothetical protein J3Q64DRAFT_1696847 [Phycomyces blakesleeanus]|uniref:protein kinase C n=1 Tax=Phycomyces blakesleeanus TaxID=4837 RepID=A0ABR3B5G8_PHYBL
MADHQDTKMRELHALIERNKTMRDKASQMRPLLRDRNAISQCETEIKEYQKYIDYFSEELQRLQARTSQSFSQRSNSDEGNENTHGLETPVNNTRGVASTSNTTTSGQLQTSRGVPPRSSSMATMPKEETEKKKYSNLDLLTSATPYNKPKVSMKLHELEYKMDVEKKVLAGIKTMANVLSNEPSLGDRKSRGEVQGQLNESKEKLNLLNRALRKYKGLYIGEGDEDDYELETPPAARMPPNIRRPVTGKLVLQIIEAHELAHAPTRMIKSPDTVVYIKIDGNEVYHTRPSRNDRWLEECEIHVNKASEVEIAIYDQGFERNLPIGIFWLKITDIAEGLRRRKVQQESGPGWVKAEVAQQQHDASGGSPMAHHQTLVSAQNHGTTESSDGGIEAWFDIEPLGQMALRLNFVRETANRRPLDKLGRAGAVRQRREEVHEMNGHQFVEKKFYNIMKCALCGEFLVNSGFQCEDCEYTCHKKCYQKVVTKCISRAQVEADPDMDKLNHRIPHRFEPITNIGANWCCHCGYMLPLGSRGSKKCSECDITCHTKCAHLVPDFCGLSMEQANQMLAEIKAAKRRTYETGPTVSTSTKHRISRPEDSPSSPTPPPPTPTPPPAPQPSQSSPSTPSSPVVAPQPSVSTEPPTAQMAQMSVHNSPSHSGANSPVMAPGSQQMHMQMPPLPTHGSHQMYPAHSQGAPPYVQPQYPYSMPSPGAQHHRPVFNPSYSNDMMQRPPHVPQYMNHPPSPQNMSPVVAPGISPTITPAPAKVSRKVTLDDFHFLAVLGKGNFGKVMLAEEKYDKSLYAIKVLKKRFIIDNDELESLKSEKRVFQAANRERHPFLINLHSTFQTESRVYFVMEYVSGGDLMWHIQREPFSERRAKFYACEVLLALEYFHSQGIIYRDLKLDNIMLGLDGHIKIADYGLCKENIWHGQTTGTFCGTPEFMAPEILLEQKYGRAVDWWAYGVLIYEMLLGQSPFRGEDEDEIFDAILEDDILYPINMSRDSVSICQRLLNRDPEKRLGAGPNDAADIRAHPFYRGVNWDDLLHKRVTPPFYPSITGRLDTSNFDEEFTRERPALTPIESNMAMNEQQEFAAFSYVAQWANHK